MTAPDRPTREQSDAAPYKAAALLLAAARVDPTLRAAAAEVQDALIALDAEVRALRADLEASSAPLPWLTGAVPDETARVVADVKAEAVWLVLHMQANGTREDIQSALRTLRLVWGDPPPVGRELAALAARTPELAEPSGLVLAAEKACAAIQQLDPDATEGTPIWDVGPDGDYIPEEIEQAFAAGRALMAAIDEATGHATNPQPAEQDVPPVGTTRRVGGNVDRWDGRRWVPTVIVAGSTRQEPDSEDEAPSSGGEDMPTRLDAAAEALEALHSHGLGYDLRQVADQLRDGDGGTPELRAAVAAALARSTERGHA